MEHLEAASFQASASAQKLSRQVQYTHMIILLHSSKTMRSPGASGIRHMPQLLDRARQLDMYLKSLSPEQLARCMHISPALAAKTQQLIAAWNTDPARQSVAIDSFVGDIYSGLRGSQLSTADRDYADQTLRILSGLYGILRPLDGICPYRLEMGYRLLGFEPDNLYDFWDKAIAQTLPTTGLIVNVSSAEYIRAVLPFVDPNRVVTPKFLTHNPATGEPSFVVVHAKIARGAFARWLITSRIEDTAKLAAFDDLGYRFDPSLSTPAEPTFVCHEFGGKGLSMRLQ